MNLRALRHFSIMAVTVAVAAIWTGTSAASPPVRTVTFDQTAAFQSPFCGDATITVHDVGRITSTLFFNADGSLRAFTIHDAALTTTLTNTETGATLTGFYSNLDASRFKFDPTTGILTVTESFTGLNILVRQPGMRPFVSAGRGVLTLRFTIDPGGFLVLIDESQTSTPNIVHLTQVLCA